MNYDNCLFLQLEGPKASKILDIFLIERLKIRAADSIPVFAKLAVDETRLFEMSGQPAHFHHGTVP